MTDPEQDDVFEAYLQRRPVLPALDDKLDPPVGLDQKVLATAREAIGPQRASVGVRRGAGAAGGRGVDGAGGAKQQPNRAPRWAVPIALAATILLSLSVVINISLNTNRRDPARERIAAARADLKSAKANAIAESDAAAGVSAGAKSPAMAFNEGERRERASGAISSNEVVLPGAKVAGVAKPRVPVEAEPAEPAARAPAAPAAAPAAPVADARVARSASAADKAAYFAKRAGVASPSAAAPPSEVNSPSLASASSQPAAADEVTPPAAPAAPDSSLTAQAPSRLAATPSPPAPAQLASRQKARSADGDLAGAPPTAASTAAPGAAPTATPAPAPATAAPHPTDPKVWLQQIDALRAAGKVEQAAAEMRRFKAAFPGYTLPPGPAAPSDLPK